MTFSYSHLGNQCESNTIRAITSNNKYIIPLSPVYYKPYTSMMYLPASDNTNKQDSNLKNIKISEPIKKKECSC